MIWVSNDQQLWINSLKILVQGADYNTLHVTKEIDDALAELKDKLFDLPDGEKSEYVPEGNVNEMFEIFI